MSKIAGVVGATVVVVAIAAVYFGPRQLEAYEMGRDYVLEQPEIQKNLGVPLTADLRLLDSRWREGECCGSAEFALDVTGANGRAIAYVNLIKERGQWRVEDWRFAPDEN